MKIYTEEVKYCSECPYYWDKGESYIGAKPECMYYDRKLELKIGEHFPDWCPLDDYKVLDKTIRDLKIYNETITKLNFAIQDLEKELVETRRENNNKNKKYNEIKEIINR